MRVIQRVVDSAGKLAGYIVVNRNNQSAFINVYKARKNINNISNLRLLRNGALRLKSKVSETTLISLNRNRLKHIVKNNPFKRDIQKDLTEWKNHKGHVVLEVQGARQIGKTTEVLKFAYSNYEYVIYVNMANDRYGFEKIWGATYIGWFMTSYCDRANLPLYNDSNKTILIIDEIQVSKAVYNTIRRLDKELNCDVIVTGSYLGQVLQKDYFQPAGNLEKVKMFNISFKEFCNIFGVRDILDEIDLYGKSDNKDYDKLFEIYDIYRQIGGYPLVLKEYAQSRSIEKGLIVVQHILGMVYDESRAYFKHGEEVVIFKSIYTVLVKEMIKNKRGNGSKTLQELTKDIIDENKNEMVTKKEVYRAMNWLIECDIIGECDLYNNGDLYNISLARKLYFTDCGIANLLVRKIDGIEKSNAEGLLTEHFAFCEIRRLYGFYCTGGVKGETPKFMTYGNYELDFIITDGDDTRYGIEVKTTDGNPKSLRAVLSKGMIDKGIVAKRTKGGYNAESKITTIPIFAVGCRFPYV